MSLGDAVTLDALAQAPYPLAARLREQEPVVYAPALDRWLVTPHALVVQVLDDVERFPSGHARSLIRSTFGPQMLSADGDEQRRHRAPYAPAFRPRALRTDVAGPVRERAEAIVSRLSPGDDLLQPASELAVSTVLDMVGLSDIAGVEQVARWYDELAAALANVAGDADVAAAGRRTAQEVGDALAARETPASGAASCLTVREQVSNTLLVLFGGIETTQSAIVNAVWALASHPAAQQLARDEQVGPAAAVEETLRWEPSVLTLTRFTTGEVELAGVRIPADSVVECLLAGANRDPAVFAEPDLLDLTRPNAADHLTFGAGRHFCLGAHLARLEAGAFLDALLARTPRGFRCADPDAPGPQGHEFRHPPHLRLEW